MNAKPKKHVPERSCVVCRQKTEKRRLTRFVRRPEGIFIDPTGKQDGRGAYLCDADTCRQKALNTDVFAKALKVILSEDDRQRIREAAVL